MKRKFLSIALCLTLCFTSMMFFTACKEKPEAVSEVAAAQELNVAMEHLNNATAVKMTGGGLYEGLVVIAGENATYVKETLFGSIEAWLEKEGDYFYEYSIMSIDLGEGEPETEYIKRLVLSEHDDDGSTDSIDDIFEMMEDMTFSNASKLNGELTINFSYEEDDVPLKFSIIIKKGVIKTIKVGSGMYKTTLDFEFGSEVLEEIPTKPTNVDWYEYQPQISIGFIETEYEVGESINLEDAYIEYLEDIEEGFTEDFDITEDMISGFTTETAGTRTMTITFYGLTVDVEYTVTEPVVE